ncbi:MULTISPECIES: flagellar hook assembly protein FlgD [Bacillaceae]|jgi:flagellar basal-body rod modification protein FlgD|uniref:Basal-body rod modification protein FlgD n=1 Tax=Niallia hominis TaxID=3133173 RepID=A0ABV1EST3_9BACI|nr:MULTISPECIES: flagellar hook assembly protein FlgD [Bacillaceae]MCF2646571.1 flagellar hook assembly protein FlgD [Niallia circulans]MCM3361528.1 flagellar hook assembly protein FlgD [Niallia sp. MER TA 168]
MANTINDSSLYLSDYQKSNNSTGSSSLGKDDFLKILITQLQNQDPTSPMDDKEFIAQMAQFSSLEQMQNLNTSMTNLISLQTQSNLISYGQFMGQDVNWSKVETDDEGNSTTTSGVGKVSSIAYTEDSVVFTLEDGTQVTPANISSMSSSSSENNLVLASQLIGKTVSYSNENKEEVSSKVQSVSLKNGQILLTLDDEAGSQITSGQITKIE